MPVPGRLLAPGPLAPDIPEEAVILQPIRLPGGEPGQTGFQTGKNVPVGETAGDGVQGVQYECGEAGIPQAGGLLHEKRDPVFPEHGLQQRALPAVVRGGHGKVPETQGGILPQQFQDPGGGITAFPGEIRRLHQLHRGLFLPRGSGSLPVPIKALRQPPQGRGRVLFPGAAEDPALCPPERSQTGEPPEGVFRQTEGFLVLPRPVGQGQGNGQVRAPAEKGVQHLQLRRGEIREPVCPEAA